MCCRVLRIRERGSCRRSLSRTTGRVLRGEGIRRKKMHGGSGWRGVGGHVAGWRMPGARAHKESFEPIAHAVRTAERGKFDFVFFADAVNTGADAAPIFVVRFEPLTLLGALSVVTDRIGLVATVSTTYSEPYNVARAFASRR